MYKKISRCRICGNKELLPVLDLGTQALTGVFPSSKKEKVPKVPLELVKCTEDTTEKYCGLLQLRHSSNLSEMYGDNYGYRSGLNASMVSHLKEIVAKIFKTVDIQENDLVVDIGSNDATTLREFQFHKKLQLVGIDPVGKKFSEFYSDGIRLIPDFFSVQAIKNILPDARAKIITSIAMFYDLEQPLDFIQEIASFLDDEGVWFFEQSYMPTMLKMNAYDTVCHEHLEYYRLKQVKWMLDRARMKIIDVGFNDTNGGSFSIMAAKSSSRYKEAKAKINRLLKIEQELKLHTVGPYNSFRNRVFRHRDELIKLIGKQKKLRKKIYGWGASTKGNVLLQFCGFTENDIPKIGEVNPYKYARYTPGTNISIVSEADIKAANPDYLLILPWHFKKHFIKQERAYRQSGGKLIFPLPKVKII